MHRWELEGLIVFLLCVSGVVDGITCYACSFGDSHKLVDDCARPNASTKTVECAGRCETITATFLQTYYYKRGCREGTACQPSQGINKRTACCNWDGCNSDYRDVLLGSHTACYRCGGDHEPDCDSDTFVPDANTPLAFCKGHCFKKTKNGRVSRGCSKGCSSEAVQEDGVNMWCCGGDLCNGGSTVHAHASSGYLVNYYSALLLTLTVALLASNTQHWLGPSILGDR